MIQKVRNIVSYRRVFGPSGIWIFLKTRLSPRPAEVRMVLSDFPHPIRFRLKSSDLPTYEKIFRKADYELNISKEPKVIVDAGANVGFASLFFAKKYPAARIIAIEPERSNFEILKENVASYPNITPLRCAIWKDNSTIDLVDPGIGHWGFQAQDPGNGKSSALVEKVPAITLDKCMTDHGINYIDILKVDIEGGEKEVFEHAANWIGKVGVIMIELHDRMKIGCSRSFYIATKDFDFEDQKGENIFVMRKDYVSQN